MNSPTIEYKKRVWNLLNRMKPGERYLIEALTKPETREQFINEVKYWMRCLPFDGWVEFNDDFTAIRKVDAVPLEQLQRAAGGVK